MIYELIRPFFCSFEELENYVPKKGEILDVGCGHGLFTQLLAKKSSQRLVLGIDPSRTKIEKAERSNTLNNLKFQVSYISDLKKKFDCICVVDVLYLLPPKKKEEFIKKCKKLLRKKGKLLISENGDGSNLIYKLIRLQETVMVKFLKFTYSDYEKLYLLDSAGYQKLLEKNGFVLRVNKKTENFTIYPRIIIVSYNK